jgi:hypothetical protein
MGVPSTAWSPKPVIGSSRPGKATSLYIIGSVWELTNMLFTCDFRFNSLKLNKQRGPTYKTAKTTIYLPTRTALVWPAPI